MIRKLVKETLVLGFSIGPWNLFDRKTRTRTFGRVPNQWGKVSLILLLPRSCTSRCLQFTNDCGKGPSNWLPLRLRLLKLLFFANVSGMVPWNVLFRKSNTKRLSLNLPKHEGIISLKLLWDKLRTLSELILQIKEGSTPLKLFLDIERK